jgi:hypothetical protein
MSSACVADSPSHFSSPSGNDLAVLFEQVIECWLVVCPANSKEDWFGRWDLASARIVGCGVFPRQEDRERDAV